MRKTRILFSNNGSITDLTPDLNNYHLGDFTLDDFAFGEDYLYIGNIAPFNHFYLKLATANTESLSVDVQYWSGTQWRSVVEVIDETNGLTQSGFITFVPDRDHAWIQSDTNGTGQTITGLTNVTIYDKYWIRLVLSANPSVTTKISWLGQKFSTDNDLGSEYPELLSTNVKTSFEAGKTDWEEQHVRAAELIVAELTKANIIYSKSQILERHTFMLPSVSKVAEMAYVNFGDDFADQAQNARAEFKSRIQKGIYDIDLNADAELDTFESNMSNQGFMSR